MNLKDSLTLKPSTVVEVKESKAASSNVALDSATAITTASITGTVYDTTLTTGTKVSDVLVTVYDSNSNVVAHGNTNALGVYLITGLTDATSYSVSAYKEGYSISDASAFTSDASKVTVQDLVIVPKSADTSNVIYGVVADSTNTAIANASVLLIDSTNNLYSETSSIDDGEYVIYNVPEGTYSIQVNAPGYYNGSAINIAVTNNDKKAQNITLIEDTTSTGAIISGIITDSEGNSVNNAFVAIYSLDKDNKAETLISYTYTNEDGKYIFTNLAEASYIIKAKLSVSNS